MKHDESFSNEELNTLLDNELDSEERARMLEALQKNEALGKKYCELRQLKDMVAFAYQDPPEPKISFNLKQTFWNRFNVGTAVAALVLLVVGALVGGVISNYSINNNQSPFMTIEQYNPLKQNNSKVLLHITTKDTERVKAALATAEEILKSHQGKKENLQLEIVVNSHGLNILRDGSPYAKQIESIVSQYDNVSFMACGRAKKLASFLEGSNVTLLPQAIEIPAAIEQVLKRIRLGWTYIRG